MIRITKDLDAVPASIKFPSEDNFPGGIPRPARTTHDRRLELIENGGYINRGIYNSRYKQDDVKTALKIIYKNKCAFCEQRIEQGHIEHYRPKIIYYWLIYSWDNLLLVCSTCNSYKGSNFDIEGERVKFHITGNNLASINSSSREYDVSEIPLMLNPEVTNPEAHIRFTRGGSIESDDKRLSYTIRTCRIDRKYLNDARRELLDVFQRDVKSGLVESSTVEDQERVIASILRKFIRESLDENLPYLAFRRYSVSNWLNELIVEIKS